MIMIIMIMINKIMIMNDYYNFLLQLLAELDLLKGELDEDDDMHNIGE